jgi:transcriptional regulator with XRE-family HTH domain
MFCSHYPVGMLDAADSVSASPDHCFHGREGWLISRHDFGSRLRTQRERRGVTLESIVESTKIKQSLLEALERGDASQWPRGLFRRAYLRNYACAIGLPVEPLVAEFVKLFPEDGSPVSDDSLAAAQEPLRLTFAIEPDTRVRSLAGHAASVAAELGGVLVAGTILSFAAGWQLLTAYATVALVYYPVATALTGRALSTVHLRSILKVHPAGTVLDPNAEPESMPLYLVSRQPPPPLEVSLATDEFPQPRTAAR